MRHIHQVNEFACFHLCITTSKGFEGEIVVIDSGRRIVVHGEIALLSNNRLQITELPIKTWTQAYKENVLETLLHGGEKVCGVISIEQRESLGR